MTCSDDYSFQTKNALAQLSEKEMSFELIEVTRFFSIDRVKCSKLPSIWKSASPIN